MEINSILTTPNGKFSVLGKKVPSSGGSFALELEKQMGTTKTKPEATEYQDKCLELGCLPNTPDSLCQQLEKVGLYVYEGWISKDQEAAMRSELGSLLQKGSLTAKDIGKKLEDMNIDVIYRPKDCFKSGALADGILDDAEWLPVDSKMFEEILKGSKSSFES